jgi:diguanylate cyclase (GGDEF)-like protein
MFRLLQGKQAKRLAMPIPQPVVRILVIVIGLLLIAAAGALAYLSYSWSRHQGIANLQQTSENRMSLLSMRLSAPTDKYSYLPKLVSSHPAVAQALLDPADPLRIHRANRLLTQLNAEAGAATIYLMGLDGLTLASSNWQEAGSFVGNNYGYRPYFLDAVRKGDGRFYAMGVTTGLPGYFLSHLVKKGGAALGVVVVKIDMHRLNQGWGTIQSQMMVTDENGVVFLSSRPEWMYRPLWPLSAERKEKMKRTRQYETVLKEPLAIEREQILNPNEEIIRIASSSEDGRDIRQVSYFAQKRKLADSDWEIVVLSPMAQIDMGATRLAIIAVTGAALLFLTFLYLSQVRGRRQERRQARRELEEAHRTLERQHRDLQALSEELRIKAITDTLTGCFNRRYFHESVVRLVHAAQRHHTPLSIIMIDIDHFKRVNDEHGHPAGDQVLITVAALCREELREEDIFARYGGEEFIAALPHTDAEAAAIVADRLRKRLTKQEIHIAGKTLRITLSAGISQHRLDGTSIENTIRRADQALYEAKENGRNRVHTR